MNETDIQTLHLNFNIDNDDLIPNGSNISVTINNINDYLQSLAEYYVLKKNSGLIEAFRGGFESVLSLDVNLIRLCLLNSFKVT